MDQQRQRHSFVLAARAQICPRTVATLALIILAGFAAACDLQNPFSAESRQRRRYKETVGKMYQNRAVLELYFREHGAFPLAPASFTLQDLAGTLSRGGRRILALDGWQRPIRYWSSSDRQHYFMISAGANGKIEYELGTVAPAPAGSGQDLVIYDGEFFYYWDGWTYCPRTCRTTESAYLECEAHGNQVCVEYLSKRCDLYDPSSTTELPSW